MFGEMKLQKEIEQLKYRCIELIQKLTEIYLKIDTPDRILTDNDSDMFFRMRKCLFHARTIIGLGIYNNTLHVIAVECRVMEEQLRKVIDKKSPSMSNESSLFMHPSPQILLQQQPQGGLFLKKKFITLGYMLSILLRIGLLYCIAFKIFIDDKYFSSELDNIENEFKNLNNQISDILNKKINKKN